MAISTTMPTAALAPLAMAASLLCLPMLLRCRLAGLACIKGFHNQPDTTGRLVENINNII
jgi:hypothetical protein